MKNKLTFIGDLTVDYPLLKASYENGTFDFNPIFSDIKKEFEDAFVIGNLETAVGNSKNYLKTEFMLLNTPPEFIEAISNGNIDCVTTANNHTLDQNVEGIHKTIDLLDQHNIKHTGSYRNKQESDNLLILEINNKKIGIIAGTYSFNESNVDFRLSEDNQHHIDLFKAPVKLNTNGLKNKVKYIIMEKVPRPILRKIKRKIARRKLKKQSYFMSARVDSLANDDFNNQYFSKWVKKIDKAIELSDIVFVCPHIGGQFNEKPGPYSQKMMNYLLDKGVHVIGNHPHVLQEIVFNNKKIGAYSLGSFNMSLSGDYVIKDSLPQYSLGIHAYIGDEGVDSYAYSLYINKEYDDGKLRVFNIYDYYQTLKSNEKELFEKEIQILHDRINQNQQGINREFKLVF